jgi:hypothetical protein
LLVSKVFLQRLDVLLIDLLEQLEVVLNPVLLVKSLNLLDQWFDILILADDLWLLLHRRHLLLKHLLSLELIEVLVWLRKANETI